MCHPDSLLCVSPKMSSFFFCEYNEELSQAAALFNSAPGSETSALYNYRKQMPSSHLPSLWKHMQHVLKVPKVKLLIVINVFFCCCWCTKEDSLFRMTHDTSWV